jgi:hypothetical protein
MVLTKAFLAALIALAVEGFQAPWHFTGKVRQFFHV